VTTKMIRLDWKIIISSASLMTPSALSTALAANEAASETSGSGSQSRPIDGSAEYRRHTVRHLIQTTPEAAVQAQIRKG
jgi:hypothetical protein